jgi:hypothetical protein
VPKKVTIQSIGVDTDGLQIGYYIPADDIKSNDVIHMHTLIVPLGADYDDEIAAVIEAARHLVLDVLDDLPRLPAGAAPKRPARMAE